MAVFLFYGECGIIIYNAKYNLVGADLMIQIYLCEDQEIQLSYFKKMIENYIVNTHRDAKIVSARQNPEHTIQDMREHGEAAALFFIDVQLDGCAMDGFELAVEIKKEMRNCYIVFLTSCNELAYKTFEYELEAAEYIVKQPQDFLAGKMSVKIEKRLDRVFRKIEEAGNTELRPTIRVESGSRMVELPVEEIVMVEAIKSTHLVDIYTVKQKIRIKETLKNIFEKLGEEFIYVNKSCIVQRKKIREINKKNYYAILAGGLQADISHREMRKLLKEQ